MPVDPDAHSAHQPGSPVDIFNADLNEVFLGGRKTRNRAGVSDQTQGACVENSQQEFGAFSGSFLGGSSNAVTPLPRLLMNLRDAAWMIGLAVFFDELFNDEWETRTNVSTEVVHQTLDMNAYLPTTYDNYRDWPTVAGTGFTGDA